MNFRNAFAGALVSLALFTGCAQKNSVDIIPLPQQMTVNSGSFTLDNNVSIAGNSQFEIDLLKEKLSTAAGIVLKDAGEGGRMGLQFGVSAVQGERYRIF